MLGNDVSEHVRSSIAGDMVEHHSMDMALMFQAPQYSSAWYWAREQITAGLDSARFLSSQIFYRTYVLHLRYLDVRTPPFGTSIIYEVHSSSKLILYRK